MSVLHLPTSFGFMVTDVQSNGPCAWYMLICVHFSCTCRYSSNSIDFDVVNFFREPADWPQRHEGGWCHGTGCCTAAPARPRYPQHGSQRHHCSWSRSPCYILCRCAPVLPPATAACILCACRTWAALKYSLPWPEIFSEFACCSHKYYLSEAACMDGF